MSTAALATLSLILLFTCVAQVSKRAFDKPQRDIYLPVFIFALLINVLLFGTYFIAGPSHEALLYVYIVIGCIVAFWVFSLSVLMIKVIGDQNGKRFFIDLLWVTMVFVALVPVLVWLNGQGGTTIGG